MMPYIVQHLGLFDSTNREQSEQRILYMLEGVVDGNCRYLEQHPETVKLYDAEVEYALPDQMLKRPSPALLATIERVLRQEDTDDETIDIVLTVLRGCEVFRDIPTILAKKKVDCDNLACMRCAELRAARIAAAPYITWRETDQGTTYHALVLWPHPDSLTTLPTLDRNGGTEDPSILLGMGGEEKAAERAEERRKNQERFDTFVQAARHLTGVGMSFNEAAKRVQALGLVPKRGW